MSEASEIDDEPRFFAGFVVSEMPGPLLPSRIDVWKLAFRIEGLARHAKELAADGPHADLHLALKEIETMRALLGSGLPQPAAEGIETA